MGARFYAPYIARWLSADTLVPEPGNPQALNRYSYVGGNALGFTDPTGHARYGGDDYDPAEPPDLSYLWDPYWVACVGDRQAAEQAFLHFLADPEYFAALYTDPAAWVGSEEVAHLDVFFQYSAFHITAAQAVERGFDRDTAVTLDAAHTAYSIGDEDTANSYLASLGLGEVGSLSVIAGTGRASSALNGVLLNRSLASAQQMGERGFPIAGAGTVKELRVARQLAVDYGGSPSDWAKMVSSSYRGADGYQFETHWYENTRTGLRVEPKTKLTAGWWRQRR
jgi:hypothetical protein